MDRFNEFYMMQTQAKKFEQNGLDEKALETYLKIISEYAPNNDFSFDRAVALLEKKMKFSQALEVCEKTIALIEAGDLDGDAEKYRSRLARIRQKMAESGVAEDSAKAGSKEPEEFHFGIPGFRNPNRLIMAVAGFCYAAFAFASYPDKIYIFGFIVGLAFTIAYGWEVLTKLMFQKRFTKALAVCLIGLLIAVYWGIQIPPIKMMLQPPPVDEAHGNPTDGGNGKGVDVKKQKTPPKIPENYLTATEKAAEKYHEVDKALASASDGGILFDVVVKADTSPEQCKAIAVDMANTLGGLMTIAQLKGPKDSYYGELYDYYSVTISMQDTMNQTQLSGYMGTSSQIFTWDAKK